MAAVKVFLVSGNEEIKNQNLLLENFLFHKKMIQENPIIFTLQGPCFTNPHVKMNSKNKYAKIFDYYTNLEVASTTLEKIYTELKSKKNKIVPSEFEQDFSSIFIYGDIKINDIELFELIDYPLLIIKKAPESSSYLYNYLKKLGEKIIKKKINIIISNVKTIEEAAVYFSKLQSEMQSMIENIYNFNFVGPLFLDLKKIIFSQKRKEVLLDTFFEDFFHGNIKYINENLEKLDDIIHTESFFKKLIDFDLSFQ